MGRTITKFRMAAGWALLLGALVPPPGVLAKLDPECVRGCRQDRRSCIGDCHSEGTCAQQFKECKRECRQDESDPASRRDCVAQCKSDRHDCMQEQASCVKDCQDSFKSECLPDCDNSGQ